MEHVTTVISIIVALFTPITAWFAMEHKNKQNTYRIGKIEERQESQSREIEANKQSLINLQLNISDRLARIEQILEFMNKPKNT